MKVLTSGDKKQPRIEGQLEEQLSPRAGKRTRAEEVGQEGQEMHARMACPDTSTVCHTHGEGGNKSPQKPCHSQTGTSMEWINHATQYNAFETYGFVQSSESEGSRAMGGVVVLTHG